MDRKTVQELIGLANSLDRRGLRKEADQINRIIRVANDDRHDPDDAADMKIAWNAVSALDKTVRQSKDYPDIHYTAAEAFQKLQDAIHRTEMKLMNEGKISQDDY